MVVVSPGCGWCPITLGRLRDVPQRPERGRVGMLLTGLGGLAGAGGRDGLPANDPLKLGFLRRRVELRNACRCGCCH